MAKRWESPIEAVLKREGLSDESVGKIIVLIHKKKVDWELAAMRTILEARNKQDAKAD